MNAFITGRGRLLFTFALGQGAVQFLGLATGFLLLRWLSVEDYAKFALVFSFQTTLALLADVGISGSIVNLVGPRGGELQTIGRYISAARWLRRRLFAVLIPAGAVAFHFFAGRHGWGWGEQAVLFLPLAACLLLQASSAWYTAPLLIHKQIGVTYRISSGAAIFRLLAASGLHLAAWLSATTMYLVNTAALAITTFWTRRAALPLVEEPEHADAPTRRELLRYVTPLIPGAIFFAFMGQISVFLISYYGSVGSLAEVGALGRLGQIFTALGALNTAILMPYFARLLPAMVPRQYALVLLLAAAGGTLLTGSAYLFPGPIAWLLGRTYAHLHSEAVWAIAASSISFIGALMYGVALARKWIFWWSSLQSITFALTTQAAFLHWHRVDTAQAAISFSAATNVALLLSQVIISVHGLLIRPPQPLP